MFSSSAATNGLSDVDRITGDTPCRPLSPYGESKLLGEWLIRDCTTAWNLRAICPRSFNVAGAAARELGDPATRRPGNLIPRVFQALQCKERPRVFGGDYPTPDGTGVRDYAHVADGASAHVAAARGLQGGAGSALYNIGPGEGCSVLDVLRTIAEFTGLDVRPEVVARRRGDPARVVAAVDRIRAGLGVTSASGLPAMVESAWLSWQYRHTRSHRIDSPSG